MNHRDSSDNYSTTVVKLRRRLLRVGTVESVLRSQAGGSLVTSAARSPVAGRGTGDRGSHGFGQHSRILNRPMMCQGAQVISVIL